MSKSSFEYDLYEIRDRIVNYGLVLFVFLGTISHFFSFLRSMNDGFHTAFYIQSSVVLGLYFLAYKRRSISLNIKVWLIVFLSIITIISGMYYYGYLATAKVYIIALPLFLSFILSKRDSFIIVILFILSYFTFAYLHLSGHLNLIVDPTDYLNRAESYFLDGFVILMATLGLLWVGIYYSKAILSNYKLLKEKSQDLEDRELKFRSIFNYSNDAIILIEGKKFFDCNLKALELFQCKRDFIIGKEPSEFSPEFQPEGGLSKKLADERFKKVYAGNPQFFEWQHIRPNGEPFVL